MDRRAKKKAAQAAKDKAEAERLKELIIEAKLKRGPQKLDANAATAAGRFIGSRSDLGHDWDTKEPKESLDKIITLVTSASNESINHLPRQMQPLVAGSLTDDHQKMGALATATEELQRAALDLGTAALAVVRGANISAHTVNLFISLDATLDEPQRRKADDISDGTSSIGVIARSVLGNNHAEKMEMACRLLQSAEDLALFACLVTCLTATLQFEPGQRPAVVADQTIVR